jgi:hypothetical protein
MRAPDFSSASNRSSEASIASRSYIFIARKAALAQRLAEIAGVCREHDLPMSSRSRSDFSVDTIGGNDHSFGEGR